MEKFLINAKVKNKNKDIKKIIETYGIIYPSDHLGFFKAVYAPLEETNRNGVRLSTKAVEDSIYQLRGSQVNFNHWREGNICGQILDAWINRKSNEIEIAFTFHKSVYEDEYEEALDLFDKGKLSVSFELLAKEKDIEYLKDGTRKIHKIQFDGVGLLMGERPAYPGAKVFERAKKMVTDIIGKDNKELIFAKALSNDCKSILKQIEKSISDKENNLKVNKGDAKVDEKAKKALMDKFKEEITAELGEDSVKDWTDEQWEEELAKRANEESSSEQSEEKGEIRKVETEENKKVTEKYDTDKEERTVTEETTSTQKVNDKERIKQEKKVKTTFTYAEVEEIKAEYEDKLKTKDEEMKKIKENAKLIAELKVELGEYVKDFSDDDFLDETKIENARLRKKVDELENKEVSETAKEEKEEEEAEDKEEEKEEEEAEDKEEEKEEEEDSEDDDSEEELPTGKEEEEEEESSSDRIKSYLEYKYKKDNN